jgi:hypothetical protein
MLHVIKWKERFPHPDSFSVHLRRLLSDPRHKSLADHVKSELSDYEKSWLYPDFMLEDEAFAFIGDALFKGGYHGLPVYMGQHYEGVLHPMLIFDHRFYQEKTRPEWELVTTVFHIDGQWFIVAGSWRMIESLVRYGGVIRSQPRILVPIRVAEVVKIGGEQVTAGYDVRIPAGHKPERVRFAVQLTRDEKEELQKAKDRTTLVFDRDHLLMRKDQSSGREQDSSRSSLVCTWDEAMSMADAYIGRRLRMSVHDSRLIICRNR